LNEVSGALDKKNLSIRPPTDATLREVVDTLQARVGAEQTKVEKELARAKAVIRRTRKEDVLVQSEERALALQERLDNLSRDVPTYKSLKTFFMRVHEAHLAASVDENMRDTVNRILANQQWTEEARRELADIDEDGNPSAEGPAPKRSHTKKAATAVKDPDESD